MGFSQFNDFFLFIYHFLSFLVILFLIENDFFFMLKIWEFLFSPFSLLLKSYFVVDLLHLKDLFTALMFNSHFSLHIRNPFYQLKKNIKTVFFLSFHQLNILLN